MVRPGGTVALLEFGLPQSQVARALWELYVRLVLPLAGRILSPGWHEVGRFLGPSIRDLDARLPLERQLELWTAAGIGDLRTRRLSLGGGLVGGAGADDLRTRPAFYALARGGWRDYVTLLHPPYTLWHLSYVAIGAALAPTSRPTGCCGAWRLSCSLSASAPTRSTSCTAARWRRRSEPRARLARRGVSRRRGRDRRRRRVRMDALALPFVAAGAFLVPAYTLELAGGIFHSDLWFGLAWGAFPVLVAYLGAAETLRPEAILAAGFALLTSLAQRHSRRRSGRSGVRSRR